jgi:hypothetical protein
MSSDEFQLRQRSREKEQPRRREPRHDNCPDHPLDLPFPAPRRATRMDRPRRARTRLPALRDGPHGPAPGGAVDQQGPPPEQRPASLDHRHLRLHGRGLPRDDGHARRPDRPAEAAPRRRGGVRRRVAAGGVLHHAGATDREPGTARDRRCDARTVDAVADLLDVQGPPSAGDRGQRLDLRVLRRQRGRAGARRRAARALLVGLRVPPGAASTCRARSCRSSRSSR